MIGTGTRIGEGDAHGARCSSYRKPHPPQPFFVSLFFVPSRESHVSPAASSYDFRISSCVQRVHGRLFCTPEPTYTPKSFLSFFRLANVWTDSANPKKGKFFSRTWLSIKYNSIPHSLYEYISRYRECGIELYFI